jgi:hypothetical protein
VAERRKIEEQREIKHNRNKKNRETELGGEGMKEGGTRLTPKLEDHPLSFVRGCLFNTSAANFHCWRPSLPSATRGRAMLWWQGDPPNMVSDPTYLPYLKVTVSPNNLGTYDDMDPLNTKNAEFWDLTLCGTRRSRRFRGTYRLHRQGENQQSQNVSDNECVSVDSYC